MRYLIPTAIIAFALDQLSKWGVMLGLGMEVGDRIDIWPPYLVFSFGYNSGINFGLFASSSDILRFVLITIALAISGFLLWWGRTNLHHPLSQTAAGLVIGGAIGNALDRIIHGAVVDFLNMSCCGLNNYSIFNVADIWIFAGAFGLILFDDKKTT